MFMPSNINETDYYILMNYKMNMSSNIIMNDTSSTSTIFPNFTLFSVHSWIGVATLILMMFQLITGLVRKYYITYDNICLDNTYVDTNSSKNKHSHYHKILGNSVYICGLATCALGLGSMQSSDLASAGYDPYSYYSLISAGAAFVLIPLGICVFI